MTKVETKNADKITIVGGSMGNIIDFKSRQKALNGSNKSAFKGAAPVLDMTEKREEIIVEERRKVKRTILTEFVGAMAVVPQYGLKKVALYDVSDEGLSFETYLEDGQFKVGEEVAMRVYLNKTTYFPFIVRVSNVREITAEGVYRHGTSFVKGTINDVALHHFVKFIENVSAALRSDSGDILVSGLNR